MKASRLARLTGTEEVKQWLEFELHGYWGDTAVCKKYMGLTGRWTDRAKGEGYRHNLRGIEAVIETAQEVIKTVRIPDISMSISSVNPSQYVHPLQANVIMDKVLGKITIAQNNITNLSPVKSKVLGLIHKFVEAIYYERRFSGMAETVFEQHKAGIDALLAGQCGEVLAKFPAVYDRLADGSPEAVSHALTTCRRIIDAFADVVYPASDKTIDVGGNTPTLGKQQTLNRINAYIGERCRSESRRNKLRQNLKNVYDRSNTGVHGEVDHKEAQSILLNVYLLLGEIISLPQPTV